MNSLNTRRAFIQASAAIGTGLFLSACGRSDNAQSGKQTGESGSQKEEGGEVTATEDLMREHGVIRRALLVYTAAAKKLRANFASVPLDALQKTARLFRAFAEDYHEKKNARPDRHFAIYRAAATEGLRRRWKQTLSFFLFNTDDY